MDAITYGIFGILIIVAFLLGKGSKSEIDNSDLTNEVRDIINRSQEAVKTTLTSEIRDRNNDSRDTLVAVLKTLGEEQQKMQKTLGEEQQKHLVVVGENISRKLEMRTI